MPIEEIETNYPRLKGLLSNLDLEDYSLTDEHTMDLIYDTVLREHAHSQNIGLRVDRINHNPREKAFHEQWLKENYPNRGINNGNGILQDLFIESDSIMGFTKNKIVQINQRDRMIVATVIQWLGSNCGMSFLHEALSKIDLKITNK